MAIKNYLTVYPEAEMTHQDFAIALDWISNMRSGIAYGCGITKSGSNGVKVAEGWIVIHGRIVHVNGGTITVPLSESGTVTKYLYAKIDLANAASPCTIDVFSTAPGTDDDDFNPKYGVAYLQLAEISITESGITISGNTTAGNILLTTLTASNWSGSSGSATYTISDGRITSTSVQDVTPVVGITAAQLKAYQEANIQDGGQVAGTLTLKAYGTKPTINIPVRVIFR